MSLFDLAGALGFYAPLLAIAAIIVVSRLRRAAWAQAHDLKRPSAVLQTSLLASAIALQQFQLFYRPNVACVLEVKDDADADEDDSGEPADPAAQLQWQLRRIRRGEKVENLVLRL